jgi:predicted nucleic-acid-binding protein
MPKKKQNKNNQRKRDQYTVVLESLKKDMGFSIELQKANREELKSFKK